MKLFVVRHGETEANLAKRYLGHSDSPLTEAGITQARHVATRLSTVGITGIYSSDLARTISSASFLSQSICVPIITDNRLRELDFGVFDFMTYTEALNAYPQEVQRWYADWEHNSPPEGESLSALQQRVHSFLSMLVTKEHEAVALYTHGGVCDLLLSEASGRPFAASRASPGQCFELLLLPTCQGWQLRSSRQA
ncbi:MAG: Adenosylcobalamin/alpha-ribazole phosphatase [Firmicutes bacterium]|nr:Adenosylcobalamin/alpha-ribazole phosphatase [Bacillota bacterium]